MYHESSFTNVSSLKNAWWLEIFIVINLENTAENFASTKAVSDRNV